MVIIMKPYPGFMIHTKDDTGESVNRLSFQIDFRMASELRFVIGDENKEGIISFPVEL